MKEQVKQLEEDSQERIKMKRLLSTLIALSTSRRYDVDRGGEGLARGRGRYGIFDHYKENTLWWIFF